jgi:peroxiredoxin
MLRNVLGLVLGAALLSGAVVLARAWAMRPAAATESAKEIDDAKKDDDGKAATAPEFPKDAEWAQGKPVQLADLRGQVVVLHFWTNGCINCIHNYPVYRKWQEKYEKKDVTIIGVHTPEFEWEAPAERVRKKAKENGLKFPIVLDPGSKIWSAWNNRYWPCIYLIDKKGTVRYRWEGELHLDTKDGARFARRLDELLAEKP